MADFKKRKVITLQTPKLTLVWPKLNDPDFGNAKFPKPDGEYSTKAKAREDEPAVQKFLKTLQTHHDAAVVQAREEFAALKVAQRKELERKNGGDGLSINPFFKPIYDEETEEPTGEIEFKFAMKASGTNKKTGKKWQRKPVIADARGTTLAKPPKIWGGTVAIVAFDITEGGYFIPGTGAVGLGMKLAGIQIIDLVSGGQRNLGFGAQDGYAHQDTDEEETEENEESTSSDETTDPDF
jgi:hypothetical protein